MSDTTTTKPKSKNGWLIGVAVLGGLVLLGQAGNSGSTSSSTTVPTTYSSGSQRQQAVRWADAIMPDFKATYTSMEAMGPGCADGNVYRCVSNAREVSSTVKHTLQVMDANPAPSCLANSESGLKTALRTIDQSVDLMLDAVNTNDVSELQTAKSKLETVGPMFNRLTAGFSSELAGCSGSNSGV